VLLKRFSHEGLAQASDRSGQQHSGGSVVRHAFRDADSFMMGTPRFQSKWVPTTGHLAAAAV